LGAIDKIYVIDEGQAAFLGALCCGVRESRARECLFTLLWPAPMTVLVRKSRRLLIERF
jgi:hypothetical protein